MTTASDIITQLQAQSSDQYRQNIIKLGIPAQTCIGVSTGNIRQLAKTLDKSPQLAHELWVSGYHEARLLAVLLWDKKSITLDEAQTLMNDVISWDLCDHLCKNLLLKLPGYETLIPQWVHSAHLYQKRAAYTLIASRAVHDKKLTADDIDHYLQMIITYSDDDRLHVKKAISWALREIAKIDTTTQEKALLTAHELIQSTNKARIWIGKDALKELETLIAVPGRKRLISSQSKMGQEASTTATTDQTDSPSQ